VGFGLTKLTNPGGLDSFIIVIGFIYKLIMQY